MIKMNGIVRVEQSRWGWFSLITLLIGALGVPGCAAGETNFSPRAVGMSARIEISESYSVHHPGMVFHSNEMLALLARRAEDHDEIGADWIGRRNDFAVGLRSVVWDPFEYSRVVITQDDSLRDNHGRPRSISRRRVRTVQSGRGR